MNDEAFNLSVRKFLKSFGLQAQHEIEQAVAKAQAGGALSGKGPFPGKVTLEVPGIKLNAEFRGEITLG